MANEKIAKKFTNGDRVEFIREKLRKDSTWAQRGLKVIFANQLSDEQVAETTKYHNNIGFTPADAHLLSSFAKQLERKNFLSDKQMYHLYKKMPKYAGQIFRQSDKEILENLMRK